MDEESKEGVIYTLKASMDDLTMMIELRSETPYTNLRLIEHLRALADHIEEQCLEGATGGLDH